MRLLEPGAPAWIDEGPLEERIVSYADKRAMQRVVSLEQRFARWQRKHPEYADRLAEALVMARHLERAVCEPVGIRPDEVARLPWVENALARAEVNGRLDAATAASGDAATARPSGAPAVRRAGAATASGAR